MEDVSTFMDMHVASFGHVDEHPEEMRAGDVLHDLGHRTWRGETGVTARLELRPF